MALDGTKNLEATFLICVSVGYDPCPADANAMTAPRIFGTCRPRPDVLAGAIDLESALEDEVSMPDRPESPLNMTWLDEVTSSGSLTPPEIRIRMLKAGEYGLALVGRRGEVRTTTDPEYYEAHAGRIEFWSPGGVVFPVRDGASEWE